MTTVKLLSTIALALLTAVVVFFAYQAMTRDALRRDAFARDAFARDAFPDASALSDFRSAAADRTQPVRATEHEDSAAEADQDDASSVARRGNTRQLALRDRSETYIQTSVLMAIRDAGYECIDIISAHPGADDLDAWRVACDGALAYLVAVDDSGHLTVDPVPYGEGQSLLPAQLEIVPRWNDRAVERPFEMRPSERD